MFRQKKAQIALFVILAIIIVAGIDIGNVKLL